MTTKGTAWFARAIVSGEIATYPGAWVVDLANAYLDLLSQRVPPAADSVPTPAVEAPAERQVEDAPPERVLGLVGADAPRPHKAQGGAESAAVASPAASDAPGAILQDVPSLAEPPSLEPVSGGLSLCPAEEPRVAVLAQEPEPRPRRRSGRRR